jgi:hypothetical protein
MGKALEMKWTGNITIKIEGKEETYPPDALMLSATLMLAFRLRLRL